MVNIGTNAKPVMVTVRHAGEIARKEALLITDEIKKTIEKLKFLTEMNLKHSVDKIHFFINEETGSLHIETSDGTDTVVPHLVAVELISLLSRKLSDHSEKVGNNSKQVIQMKNGTNKRKQVAVLCAVL